jgi:hypothetical protein
MCQFQIIYHALCHTLQQSLQNLGEQKYTHPLLHEHILVVRKTSNILIIFVRYAINTTSQASSLSMSMLYHVSLVPSHSYMIFSAAM